MASTASERKSIKNFKGMCGPLHDSATPLYFRLINACIWGIYYFCASISSFRILKKAGQWRLKSLFLFLLLQKSDGKITEFFRYLRIVITKIWIYIINLMFYIKFPYLRIPKTIFFWLECHLIMKKCPSEMHQFESADPVRHTFYINNFSNWSEKGGKSCV
jgi:hypothetical protein